jgi:hypothetical protein
MVADVKGIRFALHYRCLLRRWQPCTSTRSFATVALLTTRPDGKKKAYVRLTADHDALEVANKVSGVPISIITGQLLRHGKPIDCLTA